MGYIYDENGDCVEMDSTLYESQMDMKGEYDGFVLNKGHEYVRYIANSPNEWRHNPKNIKIGKPKFEVVDNNVRWCKSTYIPSSAKSKDGKY